MATLDILTLPPPSFDLRIAYGRNPENFCEVRLAARAPQPPLVLFVHGGFWRAKYDLGHAGHICDALRRQGANTVSVEYRRVGAGGGWPATLEDIRAAYRFIIEHAAELGIGADRIAVMGHSAGGHLALCLAAAEPGIRICVALAGVLDLDRAWELHLGNDAVVEFLGGTPSEVPERYCSASPLHAQMPETQQLIVHGTEDDIVPFEISRRYCEYKLTQKENVQFLRIDGAGHFDVIDPRAQAFQEMAQRLFSMIRCL